VRQHLEALYLILFKKIDDAIENVELVVKITPRIIDAGSR
jgi:hypothetical protein